MQTNLTPHQPIQGHRSEFLGFASQEQGDVDGYSGYSHQLIQQPTLAGKRPSTDNGEREMKDFLQSDSEDESISALNHPGEELISLH